MTSFTITAHDPGDPMKPALVALVHAAATGPPYNYAAGEVAHAQAWLPSMLERSRLALVAQDAGGAPIGYCLTTLLAQTPGLDPVLHSLGVDPGVTYYIAELGVADGVRRRGIGEALVEATIDRTPPGIGAHVVRTLADHAAAVALYEKAGFAVVPDVTQVHHHRRRLFLLRAVDPVRGTRPRS